MQETGLFLCSYGGHEYRIHRKRPKYWLSGILVIGGDEVDKTFDLPPKPRTLRAQMCILKATIRMKTQVRDPLPGGKPEPRSGRSLKEAGR